MDEDDDTPAEPARSRPHLAAASLLAALLLLAGCGDDADPSTAASGDDAVSSTALDPGESPPEIPDLPQNDDPTMVICTGEPAEPLPDGADASGFDATAVVGEPLADAERAAAERGCSIRVAIRDGESLALTEDFRPDRVNVAVEDGTVTEIISIG